MSCCFLHNPGRPGTKASLIKGEGIIPQFREPLAKLNKTVTPVTSGVLKILKNMDSGFRRGDLYSVFSPDVGIPILFHHARG